MPTSRAKIRTEALEILAETPNGVRYSELMRKVKENLPGIPVNTITGSLWNLDAVKPSDVYKPGRGIFRHTKFKETEVEEDVAEAEDVTIRTPTATIREEDFYAPFAEWIKNELEECTRTIPLGRNRFRDKWGTPDVLGIRASRQS